MGFRVQVVEFRVQVSQWCGPNGRVGTCPLVDNAV